MPIVCGIDPGVWGAIAAIDGNGAFVAVWRLPQEWPERVVLISDIVWQHAPQLWMIERQQAMPRQGRTAIASQMAAYGQLCGVLGAMRQEWREIAPHVWRRACNVPHGAGKNAALSVARHMWPNLLPAMEGWRMLSKEGGCDAALIALAGVRMHRARADAAG